MANQVILLLPNPDILQIANCYKYIARSTKPYSEIYTMNTIIGKCAYVSKILIIGHGTVGSVCGATNEQVADAIIDSGLPLNGHSSITFDNCYAGLSDNAVTSAITTVGGFIKQKKPNAKLSLSGYTGATITIGTEKRLALFNNKLALDVALHLQKNSEIVCQIDPKQKPIYWDENLSSEIIKIASEYEYSRLSLMAQTFVKLISTKFLGQNCFINESADRKVKVEVSP